MNIAVDKQNMRIVYAHEKIKVLTDLTWLEYPEVAIGIHSAAVENDFTRYSDLDLKLLYRNTTLEEPKGMCRKDLVAALLKVIAVLPAVRVNERELHHQCRAVGEREKTRYLYSPGLEHPQIMSKLFERPFLTVKRDENKEFLCATQRLYLLKTPPAQPVAAAPASVPVAAAPASVPVQAANACTPVAAAGRAPSSTAQAAEMQNNVKRPKPGTICASLWDLFDEQGASNPTLTAKDLLSHPDVSGINPSTLRTQLGHWKKYNEKV